MVFDQVLYCLPLTQQFLDKSSDRKMNVQKREKARLVKNVPEIENLDKTYILVHI